MADLGGGVSAGRRRAGAREPVPQSGARRHLRADRRRGRARRRRSRGADRRRARAPGTAASWPRRSIASVEAPRSWTSRAAAIAACSRATIWRSWQASVEPPLTYDYHGYTLCKAGPWSQAPVRLAAARPAERFRSRRPVDRPIRPSCTRSSSAPSSRSPIARRSTAIRISSTCRLATLLGDAYNDARRELVAARRVAGAPAGRDRRPRRAPARARRWSAPGDVAHAGAHGGVGEPTVAARRAAVGRDGPRGDTCHVDVIDRHGNMVAATPSGGWLQSSPVIPELGFCLGTRAPDVLARGGSAGEPRAGQAAAHHADPVAGAARRRAVHGLRHAGRRPAGPVVAARSSCATSISA